MDLEALVAIRHDLHQHPETGFKEVETRKRLLNFLENNGADVSQIKTFAKTGFTYDIVGTGEAVGPKRMIAIRADMDALPMLEWNQHLNYRSQNEGVAHMCGHDGHMTCLLGAAQVFLKNREKFGSNQAVRVLFQPAEEGPGGADPMVKEGCLEGVDEVYGFHNAPYPLGECQISEHAVMSQVTTLHFRLRNKEGAEPSQSNILIAAAEIIGNANHIVSNVKDANDVAVITMNQVKGMEESGSIPERIEINGTLRAFNNQTTNRLRENIEKMAKNVADTYDVLSDETEYITMYPPTINWKENARYVMKAAGKVLGEENVKDTQMPHMASEDFSYYLLERPGAFFFLGTNEDGTGLPNLHCPDNDFNDKLIPLSTEIWVRLIEDRFSVSIWQF